MLYEEKSENNEFLPICRFNACQNTTQNYRIRTNVNLVAWNTFHSYAIAKILDNGLRVKYKDL
jgi:hypothetical protein